MTSFCAFGAGVPLPPPQPSAANTAAAANILERQGTARPTDVMGTSRRERAAFVAGERHSDEKSQRKFSPQGASAKRHSLASDWRAVERVPRAPSYDR